MSIRSRILLKGVESAMGSNSANGSNFGNARLVRVINTHDVDEVVILTETVGGSTIAQFTLLAFENIELEKEPLNGLYASSSTVKGVAIGYSN
tara:strand:+ start:48 stop:326 length:279 start_codon:yes stop_codon:yes gene_type:complete